MKPKTKKQKKRISTATAVGVGADASEERHYCILCGKKKFAKYMRCIGISLNHRGIWKCLNCNSENRMFGRNIK